MVISFATSPKPLLKVLPLILLLVVVVKVVPEAVPSAISSAWNRTNSHYGSTIPIYLTSMHYQVISRIRTKLGHYTSHRAAPERVLRSVVVYNNELSSVAERRAIHNEVQRNPIFLAAAQSPVPPMSKIPCGDFVQSLLDGIDIARPTGTSSLKIHPLNIEVVLRVHFTIQIYTNLHGQGRFCCCCCCC